MSNMLYIVNPPEEVVRTIEQQKRMPWTARRKLKRGTLFQKKQRENSPKTGILYRTEARRLFGREY